MNKTTGIIIGIIALAIISVAAYASMGKNDYGRMEEPSNTEDENDVRNNDSMMKSDEKVIMELSDEMKKVGSYEAYEPLKIARADAGDVVLFFHASWCPSCRGLNSDIESNLSAIPEGVSILKTDYDSETDLRKKYGITYQHTLVQVDREGNMIKKWSGSPSLSSLLSQIQ